ncbi:5271_t:CDS:1 [Ambispora gerdemannii]|uniref:5271_t:CDS:1 n=1 Tax=Ambispora gerdemannii TaxID=144530 RepID=A0A9N8VDE8_9GLOM|nr:5271_t:CDS:1 [Ambispora gerdemannii]
MVKFLKPGKVAIILSGRYAGKKAVIIKSVDEGTKERPYGHAIVAGIERYPLKVTRKHSSKRVVKRSKIKPFVKVINYNHLMPTRYTFELEDLKGSVSNENLKELSQKRKARVSVRKAFQERYNGGRNKWFFAKLRF